MYLLGFDDKLLMLVAGLYVFAGTALNMLWIIDWLKVLFNGCPVIKLA